MNIFITSVIWATVEATVPSIAIDPTELFSRGEVLTVESQCPSNCQGDFPVSANRKYAERGTRIETSQVGRS
jgi:hypothetical protein